MTTIAAFAAIAIAASLVVGLVAPRLVALGAPDPVIVVAICIVSVVAAHRRARPAARGGGPMIAATDTVALAPGVEIRQELLRDAVRGHAWPLNASGAFVLARAGRPLGEVASELADAFSLSASEARGDVLRFVWQLNRLALVNIERTASSLGQLVDWLRLAARLAPAGALPAPITRRRAIDTRIGRACAREHASGRCCRAWSSSRRSRRSSPSTSR